MGGSMSIQNATNVPLDISIDQLGPLYYQNKVMPGETFYRDTGAVHFTVVASYYKEGVDKNNDWSVAKPILIAVGTGVIAAGTAGAALPAAALGLGAGSALIGTGAIVATLADVTIGAASIALAPKVVQALIDQFGEQQALSSPGWYAGKHHKLKVTGGVKQTVKHVGGKQEISWQLQQLVIDYA